MRRHRSGVLINSSVASGGRGGHVKTGCVRVLWNGNKEPVTIARNFLEYADAYGASI